MGKSNFAVFVDLENAGGKEAMLRYIIEKVKIRGDILLGKGVRLYGPVFRPEAGACFPTRFRCGALAALRQKPEEQPGHSRW